MQQPSKKPYVYYEQAQSIMTAAEHINFPPFIIAFKFFLCSPSPQCQPIEFQKFACGRPALYRHVPRHTLKRLPHIPTIHTPLPT